jgi:hypothetical protein
MSEAGVSPARPPPSKAVPLRIVLYVLTVLSAVAALFLEPALAGAVARRAISPRWLFLPIGFYGVFFLVYALDRIWLIKTRRSRAARALFQIAFGLIFASLLLPSTIQDYQVSRPQGLARLLSHPDPEVREVAVYALGYRGETKDHVAMLVLKLDDDDERVRAAALSVLGVWAHQAHPDPTSLRAWAAALSKTATAPAARTSSNAPGAAEK